MRNNFSFESYIVFLVCVSSMPFFIIGILVMILTKTSIWILLLYMLVYLIFLFYFGYKVHTEISFYLRTASNIVNAIRHGEYSLRASRTYSHGALMDLFSSINELSHELAKTRISTIESDILAGIIMEQIDVAIVAVSEQNKVNFFNHSAKKIFKIVDSSHHESMLELVKLTEKVPIGHSKIIEILTSGMQGLFNVHTESFRKNGQQNKLIFITDVKNMLRSEEQKAWMNLVRVISHEINNSLSPILSLSQTLTTIIRNQQADIGVCENEVSKGLDIISQRAERLIKFIDSYQKLAKLPAPIKQLISIEGIVKNVCALLGDHRLHISSSQNVTFLADPALIEQALINLIKNSIEAMGQFREDEIINISWRVHDGFFTLAIVDQGCGIRNPSNLFVPFYTTKKNGSGIGLLLSRQIIEAHQGRLTITNRSDTEGCISTIEIPI